MRPETLALQQQIARDVAAAGVASPQLLFGLNNPGAPDTLYVGDDAASNAGLTLQIGTTLTTELKPGAPVMIDDAPNVSCSLIYLDLTALNLSDAEFNGINAAPPGWGALPDLASRTICLAPGGTQPTQIAAGTAGVAIAIGGLTVANPPAGSTASLVLTYYNVDGITTGNFGSPPTPLGVSLLRPLDARDNDLHQDIALTVQPTLVVCSKDPYVPVANTLSIQLAPGPQGRPATAGPDTVFELHFLFAAAPPGFGALCTPKQATAFVPAAGTNAQAWAPPTLVKGERPFITLKPPAGTPIVGTGDQAVVGFDIGNVITGLQPGPTVLMVTYSGIPTYQDGSFQVVLTKMPHVAIERVTATPNPAQIIDPAGVAVVIDWVTHDAGALRLTSLDGFDADVTGRTSFPPAGDPPLLITATTTFTLEADGLYGANLDNKAAKPADAVVTPHIDFSAIVLPDDGRVRLSWNVLGAANVRIDGVQGRQNLHDTITLTAPTIHDPLPFSLTLRALGGDDKEIGAVTLKRRWAVGRSIPVGGYAMLNGFLATGIAVSPDGRRLYAFAGTEDSASISVFDSATFKPIGSIAAGIERPVGFAFAPDSSQVYVLSQSRLTSEFHDPKLTIIDASSDTVTATIRLSDLASGFQLAATIAANDKYIFIKAEGPPISLLVLDARTHAAVWHDSAAGDEQIWSGLALSRKRLYYVGVNVVKALDCQTLAPVGTADIALDQYILEHNQIVAAPDDSRMFLAQYGGVTSYQGPEWLHPTQLPGLSTSRGLAVTSDAMQGFALVEREGDISAFNVQMMELDTSAGSYVVSGPLVSPAGQACGIAVMPDDTRAFVGVLDASYTAYIFELVPTGYS